MSCRQSSILRVCLLLTGSLLTVGCAFIPKPPVAPVAEVSKERKSRNAEVARSFETKRNEVQLLAARDRFVQGDLHGSRQAAEQILGRSPDNADAQQLLAQINQQTQNPAPQPPPSAISLTGGFDGRIDSNETAPKKSDLIFDQAAAAMAEGKVSQAVALQKQAVAVNPDNPQTALKRAVQFLRSSQPERASETIEASLAQYGESADLYRTLGLAKYRQGDFRGAQLALQQALSLDKGHALSYFLQGFTLTQLGDREGAAWHFQQAARLNPKYRVSQ